MRLQDITPGTELPEERAKVASPRRFKTVKVPLSKRDEGTLTAIDLNVWLYAVILSNVAYMYPDTPTFSESPIVTIIGGATAFVVGIVGSILGFVAILFTHRAQPVLDFFWAALPFGTADFRFAYATFIFTLFAGWIIRILVKKRLRKKYK